MEPEGNGKPGKSWFRRWRNTDRRKTARQPVRGLVAYYWDGGEAVAHQVREIGPAGMFLLTERHWYPGTLITMTLQRIGLDDSSSERAISVQTRVVRQDTDGVGLVFIASEVRRGQSGQPREGNVADRKSLDAFLGSVLTVAVEGLGMEPDNAKAGNCRSESTPIGGIEPAETLSPGSIPGTPGSKS